MSVAAPFADDAVLAELVEQFASPYDFLRELVQNGLDAGASRIDVVLRAHAGDGDDVVFEIAVHDDGCGMTEAVIDGQLARLFVSSKRNDRTMAGGFGVGFVSVFAWQPDAVLLQTGRHGEAWELDFDAKGRFSKQPVAEPVEGTVVRLFRRDRSSARAAVAREIERTLWRWCRFCRLQVWFEDAGVGAPRHIVDAHDTADLAVSVDHQGGDTHVRVGFGPRSHVVLLRNALVLAEGRAGALLPRVLKENPATAEHLDVWADSAAWRTDIGRDHIVDDAGRRTIEDRIGNLIHACRSKLLDELQTLAALPYSAEVQARYSALHAHLALERHAIGDDADERPLLRSIDGPISMDAVSDAARWHAVATVDATIDVPPFDGVPTLVADQNDHAGWLAAWLADRALAGAPRAQLVHAVEPAPRSRDDVAAQVAAIARTVGFARDVYVGTFDGPIDRVWGAQVHGHQLHVLCTPARIPRRRSLVWLDARHPLYVAAVEAVPAARTFAISTLALAIGRDLGAKPAAIVRAIDALREDRR